VADFMTASVIAKTILKNGRSWFMNELSYRSDATFANHLGGCSCCGPSIKEVVFRGVKIKSLDYDKKVEVNGKELRI